MTHKVKLHALSAIKTELLINSVPKLKTNLTGTYWDEDTTVQPAKQEKLVKIPIIKL